MYKPTDLKQSIFTIVSLMTPFCTMEIVYKCIYRRVGCLYINRLTCKYSRVIPGTHLHWLSWPASWKTNRDLWCCLGIDTETSKLVARRHYSSLITVFILYNSVFIWCRCSMCEAEKLKFLIKKRRLKYDLFVFRKGELNSYLPNHLSTLTITHTHSEYTLFITSHLTCNCTNIY